MKITLNIKNYELVLPIGLEQKKTTNTIKVFTKKNNEKITHVFFRFKLSDNDKKKPVKQLHEDTKTKLKYIRLFLGENVRSKILDFLRNEKNIKFTCNFNADNFNNFSFRDIDDDDIFRNVNSFEVHSFHLHTKNPKIKIPDTISPNSSSLFNI
ncbi:hypothetical protein KO494_03160 [Lacinutrix sp. C3R15]|uniref:hypothetical protein n=1 Tax=Flavobacteriaceae TaxID=49546 RepID=UPI001C08915F|nr:MULTISPECIES: hypothetical protein [Flavobacteriaceae]MBU2938530.1 hypothetical protein [Lacinutrix sp. C3R15]MDO6621844.1 hypothetical protein [Oceanihabitans sp. 1_MG-2023]